MAFSCAFWGCSSAIAATPESARQALFALRLQAMQVGVAQDSRPGCAPTCARWIAAQGKIEGGTPRSFARVLRSLGAQHLPVYIDSLGGSVDDAIAIGKLIRARHLDVVVSKTEFDTCDPTKQCAQHKLDVPPGARPQPVGSVCASACVLVLASGTKRYAALGTGVGVHQMTAQQTLVWKRPIFRVFYRNVDGVRIEVSRQLLSDRIVSTQHRTVKAGPSIYDHVGAYLTSMGVSEDLVPLMMATPSTSVHWLSPGEERATAIVTNTDSLDAKPLLAIKSIAPSKVIPEPYVFMTVPGKFEPSPAPSAPASDGTEQALLDIIGQGAAPHQIGAGHVAWALEGASGTAPAVLKVQIGIPDPKFGLVMRIAPVVDAIAGAPLEAELRFDAADEPTGRIEDISGLEVISDHPPLAGSPIPITAHKTEHGSFKIQFTESAADLSDHLLAMRRPWLVLHMRFEGGREATLKFEHDRSTPLLRQALEGWTRPFLAVSNPSERKR